MNPRQFTGLLVLIITGIGAVVVFFLVYLYVEDVRSEVGPTATVLELTEPVEALEPIPLEAVSEMEVPQRWIPDGALTHPDQLAGLVAASAYEPGVTLQSGMLVAPPGLEPGYREVAIMVDAETGVAGQVRPGDRVDIIATIAGDEGIPQRAEMWVTDALILQVGVPVDVEDEDAAGNFVSTTAIPVTFALDAQESLRLAYGESFSVKLRLALRGAGDEAEIPEDSSVYTDPLALLEGTDDNGGNDEEEG